VFGCDDLADGRSLDGLGVGVEDGGTLRVRELQDAVLSDEHAVAGLLDDGRVLLLALPEFTLATALLGDVPDDARGPPEAAVVG